MDLLNVEPVVGFGTCRLLSVVGVLTLSACSGSTPTSPTVPPTPPSPPVPTTYTMSGAITATNGGQPLAGVTVDSGSSSALTDPAGRYALSLTLGTALLPLRVSGAGVLTHSGYAQPGQAAADFDAIRLDGQFDPTFFREFAHNGYESPARPEPIARWTQSPNVYLMTVDDLGHAVEPRTLTVAANAIVSTVGAWTGGRFGIGTLEQGTGSRLGQAGWVTVEWYSDRTVNACGRADIGHDRGAIELFYLKPDCSCPGTQMRALTIKHELGHALGYYHTSGRNDLMYGGAKAGCDQDPTAREQYHAAIVYRRPNGNMDPDEDARP